jgi:NADH-quinone oxidoreductase subunit F
VILERNPHQLLEGILITCHAIRSKRAYVYIRGEFGLARKRMDEAIQAARKAGLWGDMEIVAFSGAGAYICGEETSLLNSIEGKKGFPRNKPPFPANVGLYGCPTIVNNVQTLATLPWILRNGPDAYLKIGRPGKSTGTHLFGVSGHVKRPGIYEAPLGYPFQKLIYEDCGGILDDRKLKAVIPGGSSVYILRGEETNNLLLDVESIRDAGSLIGTGAIIVMAEGTCLVKALWILLRFYAHESCGQCTPCREGLGWLRDIVGRIEKGQGKPEDVDELIRLVNGIEGNTICPLADAACWPVRSYVAKFRPEFLDHIQKGRCPFDQKFLKTTP